MTMERQNDGDQENENGTKGRQPLDNEAYTVGWICAVSTEYVAARAFLDEEHEYPEHIAQHDNNCYTLGRMGRHNVVIAVLPDGEYGLASAATVARDMLHSFPNVRIGLMVGIGGGAPSAKNDIRLGDVVVSAPRDGRGGVFQYDYGKTIQDQIFHETGFLAQPPTVLRTAVSAIKAHYESDGHQIQKAIGTVLQKKPRLQRKYRQPNDDTDRLYRSDVKHPTNNDAHCATSCSVDASALILRRARDDDDDKPIVHYGLIASANQLMKDAVVRDKLACEKDVLCFELEAAGLMNHFPCLVIRGICDYADTHKNKKWQGYAAMTAAAYAKDILERTAPNKVEAERRLSEHLADIDESLRTIHTVTMHIREGVSGLEDDGLLRQLRAWLCPADPSTNFNKARKQHHQGTGQWLLESDQYKRWKTERNSLLWLNGISGCGKTILSSSVVADLEDGAAFQRLVYFYFDFNDVEKQSVEKAVRSLVIQLCYKRRDLRGEVYDQCRLHDFGSRQPSSAFLFTLFQNMVRQAGEVWIVFDALDECYGRDDGFANGLLSWMESLRNAHFDIHFLATSQPKQDLQSRIENWSGVEILPLSIGRIQGDINSYIEARTKKMGRWESRPEVQKEIEDTLVAEADGMFRWVACQFDTLEDCLDRRSVRSELATLPRDLETTYKRILQRIPTKHLDYTKRLLQFMTYSERPLRLEEAVDVIAVDPSCQPQFDPVDRMPLHEEVVRYCSSLAVLVRRENEEDRTTITEIQLAHFSVRKYLMSNQLESDMASDLEVINAKAAIVQVCISYLLSLKPSYKLEEVRRSYPLAQYSAQFWAVHAGTVELARQEVAPMAKNYFANHAAFTFAYRLYRPDCAWKGGSATWSGPVSALYYASLSGLCRSVHALISDGADVNARGGYYRNALQAASSRGHKGIVELLLANGADVNAKGGVYGNALRAASSKGHEQIVQLLLKNGAKIDRRTGRAGNALYAASSRGHAKIVRLLLINNANVNMDGGYFGNALQAASSQGHNEVISILQTYKATGGLHSEALHIASDAGHSAALELLEQNETDFSQQNNVDNVVYPNSSDYQSIVDQLLEKGDNINAQGGHYGTALQAASVKGNPHIVKLLLDKGANVDAWGGVHHTALHAASTNGCDEVVRLLLDRGADVNVTDSFCNPQLTPLHVASWKGHEKVAKVLLEGGAHINATTESNEATPLHVALLKGQRDRAKLLLEKDADINDRHRFKQTPMQIVLLKEQLHKANSSLKKYADANTKDWHGYTPLYYASIRECGKSDAALYKGREGVAKLLLENGADLNITQKLPPPSGSDRPLGAAPDLYRVKNNQPT